MNPKIGSPRVYPAGSEVRIYPGEMATAQIKPEVVERLIRNGGGTATENDLDGWIVHPAPGVHALWLRWSYRLIWQWLPQGQPKLLVSMTTEQRDDDTIVRLK